MSSNNCPTPHNEALLGEFAPTCLMPGDPLRAKFIAENFLENAKLINYVRGISGYTGTYNGKKISVMASGMGMPSIGIYSYELFKFYNVENIIRIGSAGAMQPDIKLRDIVLGIGACTDSNYASQFGLPGTFAPVASYKILSAAEKTATKMQLGFHIGNLLSTDAFYGDTDEGQMPPAKKWGKMGVMAVEMEAAALYMNAARLHKNALAICTISDHLLTLESTTSKERQESFTDMMELSLDTALML